MHHLWFRVFDRPALRRARRALRRGPLRVFVDVRSLTTVELIYRIDPKVVTFASRTSVANIVFRVEACRFPSAGLYLVQLFCDNSWVCDAQLTLR